MPKNSSMKIRTSASLIPTSSFQIARTNFIVEASEWLRGLASGRVAATRPNLFDRAPLQLRARRSMHGRGENFTGTSADGAWRDELRATLALAWPLILANLTQQAIQATDVLLMGRLGATQLAAATLALNLTFTFNLLLLGLVIASSPMMATALGQRFNAVRDVRRTFRAGLWLIAIIAAALLAAAVARRAISCARSAVAGAREPGPDLPARLHVVHRAVAAVPAAAQLRLRARAAADRPVAQPRRHRAQRAAQLVADLRPFRACPRSAWSAAASAARSPG